MNPKIPGIKYYYPDILTGRKIAGHKILSLFKMLRSKKYVKNISSLLNKVKKIQSFWRRALILKHHREAVLANINKKLQVTANLQNNIISKWPLMKSSSAKV